MKLIFKRRIVMAVCVTFIAVASVMHFAFGEEGAAEGESAPAKPSSKRVIFSAPFDNETGQGQYEPTAAGMGDLLAVMLAQHKDITVVERQQLAALTAEQILSLKGLTTREYAIRVGKLLKADTVLVGRLLLAKGKLQVGVQALDIATARVVAADQIACRPTYLVEAALQMARRLGKQMSIPLPKIDLKKIDKSPIASLHFGKALSRYYAGNMDAALMQFMWTTDLDPDYTEAHYWSGMCYYRLGDYGYAIIEWTEFLKREPNSRYSKKVTELLGDAKEKQKQSVVQPHGLPRI